MFEKRLTVSLCDFKSKPLKDLSPISRDPFLFSELKINMNDRNCKKENTSSAYEKTIEKKRAGRMATRKSLKMDEDEDRESNASNEDSHTGNTSLCAYEKMIERNRAERMAVLKSLKMDEVKAELCEIVNTVKGKTQPVKRKCIKEVAPAVCRKSSRLASQPTLLVLSESAVYQKALNEAKKINAVNQMQALAKRSTKKMQTPTKRSAEKVSPEVTFKAALQVGKSYENYCRDLDIQNPKAKFKFFSYDKSIVKSLTLHGLNTAQVTRDKTTAVVWHPVPDNLILAAGDKCGYLGIWKVDSKSSPYVFKTHNGYISNLMFNPFNPNLLVSSSYDGTLHCGDMVKHVFNEVYNECNKTGCTYFDFLSQTTYLVAQRDGRVALVDSRAVGETMGKKRTSHEYSIKTVHVHPVNRNVFVTAETRGSVRLWDLRSLQRKPVADIQYHKNSVSSAYFSPITGNSILTTSLDNTISIFDSTNLTKDIELKKSIEHNNKTPESWTIFRATWLPNSEEAFVVGSMNPQRRIELYDKDMNVYHIIEHENLCAVTSVNIFHPSRPALAGANHHGRAFIFTTR